MSKCPLCQTRKARRACPALNRQICAVCCGTKRQVEITCPTDCGYLAASKAHPPAVVQRQIERDMTFLLPFLTDLSEAQYELFRVFMGLALKQHATAIPPLVDSDVAEGAAVVASTLETAGKGIIYQHQAQAVPAQRLAAVIETFVTDLAREAGAHARAVERDAAVALRQLSRAAEGAAAAFPEEGGPAFLNLLDRIMTAPPEPKEDVAKGAGGSSRPGPDGPSGLIIPG